MRLLTDVDLLHVRELDIIDDVVFNIDTVVF